MPTLNIEIELKGSAVEDAPREEVTRMLAQAVKVLDRAGWGATNLRDSNGITVGSAWIEED